MIENNNNKYVSEASESKTSVFENPRIRRGMAILAISDQIEKIDQQTFKVKSQSNNGYYIVTNYDNKYRCTCPDHKKNDFKVDCKHIHAIKLKQVWNNSLELLDAYKEINEKKTCRFCGSENIEKHGFRYIKNGKKQRYRCKDCDRRFVVNDGFSNMKYQPEVITQALDLYFKGLSLRKVKDHFMQFLNKKIHHTTILNWIEKYTRIIDSYISNFKPELGSIWHTDEMMIRSGGKWSWLWHTLDRDTRFMIANMISNTRTVEDARNLFKTAKKHTNTKPDVMVTDGLQSYNDAFNKEFYHRQGKQSRHIRNAGIAKNDNNNMVERLHNTVREREKIMRGMQNNDTAKILMDGFRNYYNILRPHMGIDNCTPAERAGLNLELGRNKIQNLIKQSVMV
jgi:transposase-like protein